MTNNTPDYEDNLYFECKNCKMTDEYCASGDCPNDKTNYDILKEYEEHCVPVPSYDEWRTLKLSYEYCPTREKYIMKLEIKNAQLKDQIEHANRLIKWVRHSSWSCDQQEDDFDRYVKKWGVE